MALTALPVDAASAAVNQTTNHYSVNGAASLSYTDVQYTCPADRRAKFGLMFYRNQSGYDLYVRLYDDLAHPTGPINDFHIYYGSTANHFDSISFQASHWRPHDTEQWSHYYNDEYISRNMDIFPGQYIAFSISGTSLWRFVYRIIEEDM